MKIFNLQVFCLSTLVW